jgi:hypothetical protein
MVEHKMQGKHPVYCQTPAAFCSRFNLLLGYYPLGVAVRCPVCGRFTRLEPGQLGGSYGKDSNAKVKPG